MNKNLFNHELNESVAAKAALSCIKGRIGLCESIPTFSGKTYNGGIDVDEDGNLYAFGGYDDDDFVNVPYLNKFDDIHKDVVDVLNRTFWTWFYDSDNYVDNIDQYTDDNVGTAIEKVLDATEDFPSNNNVACYRWFEKHGDQVLDNLIWGEKESHLAKHPQFTFEQAEEESGQVSIKITKKLEDEAYEHLCDVYKKYRGRGPQTWEVVTEYIMKKHNLDPYKSWHELTQGDKNTLNSLNKKLGRKWQKQHADDKLLIKYNKQHGVEQEEESISSLQRGDILNALAQQADTYPELMSVDGDLDEIFNIIAEVVDEQNDYPLDISQEECEKWIDKYYDRLVAEYKRNKSQEVLKNFEQDQEYDMVTLLADRLSESYLAEDWEDIYYAVKRFSNVLTHYMPQDESQVKGWLRRWADDIQDIINTPANARNVNEKVDDIFEIMMQHGGIEILYNANKNVVKDEIRKQLSNTPEDQFPWSEYLSKKSWVQSHKHKIADRLKAKQREEEGYIYV